MSTLQNFVEGQFNSALRHARWDEAQDIINDVENWKHVPIGVAVQMHDRLINKMEPKCYIIMPLDVELT